MTCMWSVRGAVRGLQGRWGVKVPSLLGRLGGSVENRGLVWLYEMTDVRGGGGGHKLETNVWEMLVDR